MLVSDSNMDYSELLDGNLATCIQLNQTWCDVAMKVDSASVEQFSSEYFNVILDAFVQAQTLYLNKVRFMTCIGRTKVFKFSV